MLDTAPGLRPADILITAVTASYSSALDVGVAAPHAAHAGVDCCETMRLRKIDRDRDYLAELDHQGVEYKPLIWSCWGREHEDKSRVLRQLARIAARRRGDEAKHVLAATRDNVGAAFARRSAAMLLACAPGAGDR